MRTVFTTDIIRKSFTKVLHQKTAIGFIKAMQKVHDQICQFIRLREPREAIATFKRLEKVYAEYKLIFGKKFQDKLSKDICKKCTFNIVKIPPSIGHWEKIVNKKWKSGEVFCLENPNVENPRVNTKLDAPEFCPYILEHLFSRDEITKS